MVFYSPDAFSDKDPSTTDAGTVADGRQKGEISTSLSREMRNLTLQLTGGIDLLGEQKALHLSDGSTTHTDQYNDYFFGLRTQTRLTSRFAVDFGGIYTLYDKIKGQNPQNSLVYTIKQGDVADLYAGLDYHIIPNRFVASAEYDHYLHGTTKQDYSLPSPTNNISLEDTNENLYEVRLHYLFF